MSKTKLGIILIVIGIFLDRIFYNIIYLPKINKTFALKISFTEIISFYKWPIAWVAPVLIIIGLIMLFVLKKKGQ